MNDTRHLLKPEELEALEQPAEFFPDLICEYRDHMGDDDAVVEAMLVSTQGASAKDLTADKGRIDFLMKNRHGTPFEHTAIKFYVRAPIMVFREWHRHRIGFSYNEVSARYKVMEPHFYIPGPERPLVQHGKHSNTWFEPATPEQYDVFVNDQQESFEFAWYKYAKQLKDGIAKEVARDVLGVGLYSQMFVTLNLRSALSFLSLRQKFTAEEAAFPSSPQWEINQCANRMEATIAELFPLTHECYVDRLRVAP